MEIPEIIKSGIYIAFVIGIIVFSSYVTDEIGIAFYELQDNENKIFDMIHSITPDLHMHEDSVNIIPFCILLSFFFIPNGLELSQQFASMFFIVCILRSLTIMTTILPKHEKCSKRFHWSNIFQGQCYDKVFSGHTSFVFLATLIFFKAELISLPFLVLINFIEATAILLTRSHYTVDVLLAYMVSYMVFQSSHAPLT
jgi:hypothetical protein